MWVAYDSAPPGSLHIPLVSHAPLEVATEGVVCANSLNLSLVEYVRASSINRVTGEGGLSERIVISSSAPSLA